MAQLPGCSKARLQHLCSLNSYNDGSGYVATTIYQDFETPRVENVFVSGYVF